MDTRWVLAWKTIHAESCLELEMNNLVTTKVVPCECCDEMSEECKHGYVGRKLIVHAVKGCPKTYRAYGGVGVSRCRFGQTCANPVSTLTMYSVKLRNALVTFQFWAFPKRVFVSAFGGANHGYRISRKVNSFFRRWWSHTVPNVGFKSHYNSLSLQFLPIDLSRQTFEGLMLFD